MRQINEIIVHCTATREYRDYTVEQVREWHVIGNGWRDIGYHFLITLDGTVYEGRPIAEAGAHCAGHNAKSIGICYVGGLDQNGKPKDTRTSEQKAALVDLCYLLCQRYGVQVSKIRAHNEHCSSKACPSFSGESFRKEVEQYIRELV